MQLLAKVREVTLSAYDSQEVPFEKLVEELRPERQLNRNPFFDVSFSFQNLPLLAVDAPDLDVELLRIDNGTSKFDLGLVIVEAGDRLMTTVEYSSDLFDASTPVRLLDSYKILLEAIAKDPQRPISRLPLLTNAERARILEEWNTTGREYRRGRCIQEVFGEQARLRNKAVAVVFGGRKLSYEELDVRSEALAEFLAGMGVRRGCRVGICLEPSVEMVVGLLGILKAGAAYVPIDPEYPEERVKLMLKEAETTVLLTEGSHCGTEGIRTVKVENAWQSQPAAAGGDRGRVVEGLSGEDEAYVIFTSGSTGKPKGVCVPHRAVINLVVKSDYVELRAEDVVGQASNCCFDAAVFEIWGALLNGSRLVGIGREDMLSAEKFSAQLESHGVTTLFVTTALFNELVHERAEIFGSVRTVLFGGEECDAEAVRRVLQSAPPERLLNMYGPTETTTFATWYEIKGPAENCPWRVPIGRPIHNTQVYILDEHLEPVPIGVAGEIWIGGEGVAKGYLNRPELTAERFVASPFVQSQRLYRTGDQGCFRSDGNIEYLGRIDQQVKIRGFRVEPGEIESVLMSYPGVRQAAVCARERGGPGKDKQLVGYVVMEQGRNGAPIQPELRAFLKSKLPDYMMPAAFVLLEKLPLTATGKIDRLALPAPEWQPEGYRAPRTPDQEILCGIFANLLSLERVGIDDNFFELGGHSLLAIRLLMRVRNVLHIEIPVTALFEHPTISAFSRHIDEVIAKNSATVRPPIEKVSRDQPLPLSFAQERLWRNERNGATPDTINVVVLDLKGELNIACLERTFQELMRRHEVFRTTYHVLDNVPVQRIAPYRTNKLEVFDLSQAVNPEIEATRLVENEKAASFSLEHGPLVRFFVLRLGERHHRLIMKLHHIVYDIWSLPIFNRELDTLYRAFVSGKNSPLPEPAVQLADFAVWQRRYLHPDSNAFRAQLAYWKDQLSGELPVLRLPCERPYALETASITDVLAPFEMSEELSANIRAITRGEGTTLFITFLTGLKALINLTTGQNDIMLGAYLAKRTVSESEEMMGYFCDLAFLRTRVPSHLSFLELLQLVRETVLNAHAHQDMPFDVLREEFEKLGQIPPAPRVIFMFEIVSDLPFRLGDLQVNGLPLAAPNTMPWRFQMRVRDGGGAFSGRAKFDARLHDPPLVRRMMRNYVRLLEAVVARPTTPLCEVEEELGSW